MLTEDFLKKTVRLALICPTCGNEQVVEYPVAVVAIALTRWNNMNLHSSCHPISWSASPCELKKIRDHMGENWIEEHRV